MSVTIAAYKDMLSLPRPPSKKTKKSVENRAKLFTPFSALRGFDIEILTQERDKLLVPRESLSDGQQESVWRTLNSLQRGDWVTLTYFVPGKHIAGQLLGEYTMTSGVVKKVDDVEQLLVLEGCPIPFGDIHTLAVQGLEGAEPA